jgi:hypothetical protein
MNKCYFICITCFRYFIFFEFLSRTTQFQNKSERLIYETGTLFLLLLFCDKHMKPLKKPI